MQLGIPPLLCLWREEINWRKKRLKKLIHWAAAESIPSRSRNSNMSPNLNQLRRERVSGMAWINKSSNEVWPFMHSKWIFVVLATAWRCVILRGNSLFGCCQGDKPATCPCYCRSSPALQPCHWLLYAYAWDVSRAVSWLYTGHFSLQPWHLSHQQAHWTSALLPSGLTWTDSFRATRELSLLLVLHALGKIAPQHTLLYSSKCKKPLWMRRA